MTAFQGAVDLGYRCLETDIRISSDGTLMVFHDATLERTTNGNGKVRERTAADLQQLDAGHRFERDAGAVHRDQGIGIPTLEELLTTYPEAVVSIDMKENGLEVPLAALIKRLGAADRVIVGSFSGARISRFRTLTGQSVATGSGRAEMARFLLNSRLGRPTTLTADVLMVPVTYGPLTLVDRKTVSAVHAALKLMIVWTIDDGEEMGSLLDLGVDGIITDRPDTLREVMKERGEGGPWHEGRRRG